MSTENPSFLGEVRRKFGVYSSNEQCGIHFCWSPILNDKFSCGREVNLLDLDPFSKGKSFYLIRKIFKNRVFLSGWMNKFSEDYNIRFKVFDEINSCDIPLASCLI